MADDIIHDFELMALEMKPKTPEDWRLLTAKLRQKWGGERTYVCKDAQQGKALSLAEGLAAGLSLSEALAGIGINDGLRSGYARRFVARWGYR
jgi:hypothetical protein